ncbi:hypothetical protein Scep_029659 [Stephania cephalantha]|uniref:Uncharacterized protein n=1 Tax=Stephania cephalantha TaxID=152367 RepID=A0AAP0HCH7_9MAGN
MSTQGIGLFLASSASAPFHQMNTNPKGPNKNKSKHKKENKKIPEVEEVSIFLAFEKFERHSFLGLNC